MGEHTEHDTQASALEAKIQEVVGRVRDDAAWVGARLPSEAEWAFVASDRGQTSRFPWGSAPISCERADTSHDGVSCGGDGMSDVCHFSAGEGSLGLCDLIGNVSELTADPWHSTLQSAPVDGSAWCSGAACEAEGQKTVRGGSHATRYDAFGPAFSLHSRFEFSSSSVSDSIGFRLARGL